MLLWVKVLVGAFVLALLAGAVAWCAQTIHKANGYDAAVARADQAQAESVALAKTFADAHADDVAIEATLSQFRAELGKQSRTFANLLNSHPITREVPRDENDTTPCHERIPAFYRELWNCAAGEACPAGADGLF